ncbi:uncharacterized protein LOC106637464 [Copidosoma floridanum]|uniref:uncharacterized protein LOC106637464 n=1 Tax=Copidosoma floridanum TaxID=29053 RepID=UPI0006C9A0B0|nr:uncharacterized protein LOC106637464 [Copidosoma floridanum]
MDPDLQEHYVAFMSEYIRLGHMRPVSEQEMENCPQRVNYIPHHAIWQRSDGGRRLRVVFNDSSPTSTGYSLNDALYPGPKLQNDIVSVLTRWRFYRVAFCADIKMMFRQIQIRKEDVHLRVIWSQGENEPETHYVLLTVTYVEASAPYLALKTLTQLCEDEGAAFPEAVDAVRRNLYVDDFLTGADDEDTARKRRDQLVQLLKAGGFVLKKWVSNTPSLLHDLKVEDLLRPSWLHFTMDDPVNELGTAWDPSADCFRFSPPAFNKSDTLTKRRVLAEAARLFDPAGWLSPIIVVAKMLIQDLWRAKLTRDEPLPASYAKRWESFRSKLSEVSLLTLTRWLQSSPASSIQLHAFADASRRALATVIYIRVEQESGTVNVSLIGAKTKLSPIKSLVPLERQNTRMTIPRLELRAALLAARLLRLVDASLTILDCTYYLWSDSSTVLSWLCSSEPVGNDLVDNYVHHIQELTAHGTWRYVPSSDNPADITTRGVEPSTLQHNTL